MSPLVRTLELRCTLPLSKGETAIVDPEDYDRVRVFSWHASKRGRKWYAQARRRGRGGELIYLHRLILGVERGVDVDHVNGDGLDCRRVNLRRASRTQNNANQDIGLRGNTSSFKGVYRSKRQKGGRVWRAQVTKNGRKRTGSFYSESEAATAYNQWALQEFGEFAKLNQI